MTSMPKIWDQRLLGVLAKSRAPPRFLRGCRCKDGPPRAQEVHGRMQNELELSGVVAAVMTSAAFSSFREPPVPSNTMPRLPQLCGSPVAGALVCCGVFFCLSNID